MLIIYGKRSDFILGWLYLVFYKDKSVFVFILISLLLMQCSKNSCSLFGLNLTDFSEKTSQNTLYCCHSVYLDQSVNIWSVMQLFYMSACALLPDILKHFHCANCLLHNIATQTVVFYHGLFDVCLRNKNTLWYRKMGITKYWR